MSGNGSSFAEAQKVDTIVLNPESYAVKYGAKAATVTLESMKRAAEALSPEARRRDEQKKARKTIAESIITLKDVEQVLDKIMQSAGDISKNIKTPIEVDIELLRALEIIKEGEFTITESDVELQEKIKKSAEFVRDAIVYRRDEGDATPMSILKKLLKTMDVTKVAQNHKHDFAKENIWGMFVVKNASDFIKNSAKSDLTNSYLFVELEELLNQKLNAEFKWRNKFGNGNNNTSKTHVERLKNMREKQKQPEQPEVCGCGFQNCIRGNKKDQNQNQNSGRAMG